MNHLAVFNFLTKKKISCSSDWFLPQFIIVHQLFLEAERQVSKSLCLHRYLTCSPPQTRMWQASLVVLSLVPVEAQPSRILLSAPSLHTPSHPGFQKSLFSPKSNPWPHNLLETNGYHLCHSLFILKNTICISLPLRVCKYVTLS